jgi:hypothetical protein
MALADFEILGHGALRLSIFWSGSHKMRVETPNYNKTAFCNLFLAAEKGSKGCMVLEYLSLALKLEPAEH